MKRKTSIQDVPCSAVHPSNNTHKRLRLAPADIKLQSLSDELILQCMNHLDYRSLLLASEVDKHLHRLANDDHIWKALFQKCFSSSRSSSSPLFTTLQRKRTWKELFKVSHNWTTGNARTTQLSLRSSLLPDIPQTLQLDDDTQEEPLEAIQSLPAALPARRSIGAQATLVAWHGHYYLVAERSSPALPGIPGVTVQSTESGKPAFVTRIESEGLAHQGFSGGLGIAEMRLDDALYTEDEGIRLAVFYTSGQYSIFRLKDLHSSALSYYEEYFHSTPSSRPTVLARFHSPLLVTCAGDCSVRFRLLEEVKTENGIELIVTPSQPTMRSYMCFAPMVMRLDATTSARQSPGKAPPVIRDFRVTLAYSTPYYPAAFTVGAQVFDIRISNKKSCLDITARSAIAVPPIMPPLSPSSPSSNMPAIDIPASQGVVTSIEQDGAYIVTSKSDNTISIYELQEVTPPALGRVDETERDSVVPASPSKLSAAPALRLRHVRTLFGHTSAVDSVGVLDGRCVSIGRDGVKVWELPQQDNTALGETPTTLEEETITELWPRVTQVREDEENTSSSERPRKCSWLGLDASRIVTVSAGSTVASPTIKVYNFE